MALIKKFATIFIASAVTLYALWIGILYLSYDPIPANLYSDPLPIFFLMALFTALFGCTMPLRTRRSRLLFGCLFSALLAGVLSVIYGH